MKRTIGIAILVMMILLTSCHAVPPQESTTTKPGVTTPQNTEPAMPGALPTEPAPPKELVCESRDDGLVYIPAVFYINWSGKATNFQLQLALDANCYPNMQITYELSSNFGELRTRVPNSVVEGPVENRTPVLWMADHSGDYQKVQKEDGAIFVEAVIRADGMIVGCGIYEIGTEDGNWFALMRSETRMFPMLDGALQEITEEDIAEELEKMKQTVTPLDLEAKKLEEETYWEEYWAQQDATN